MSDMHIPTETWRRSQELRRELEVENKKLREALRRLLAQADPRANVDGDAMSAAFVRDIAREALND